MQRIGLLPIVFLAAAVAARAADITGKWTSDFDTQIGHLKYVYKFKQDGAKLTGQAHREAPQGNADTEIKDGKVDGDNISFQEPLHIPDQDQEIVIEYTGKVDGDQIKFTRKVGDFGAKEIVAKRAQDGAATTNDGASVNGKWRAEFDTQIGKQKYLFTLNAADSKVTGTAHAEFNAPNDGGAQKVDTALEDGALKGAEISFTENMKLGDMTLPITYKGTVSGDQIKLTRKVGDFATEELTANREK